MLYYGFAVHLPSASNPLGLGMGRRLRGAVCAQIFKSAGRGMSVGRGAYFGDGSHITIGAQSCIGINARLYGPGEISIGDGVLMSPEVAIVTGNHRFDDPGVPIQGQGREINPVVIEDFVWIGMRAIILPGVRIGRSSVIGAGAVVAGDIPPYSVAVGVPARVIKKRNAAQLSAHDQPM